MANPTNQALARREEPYQPLSFAGLRGSDIEKRLLDVHPFDHSLRHNGGGRFTFVKEKNLFSGEFGWKPKEIANFDPVAPAMVLHDLWEHAPFSPATIIEEFQAVGAAFHLRMEGGYFQKIGKRASDVLPNAFGMLYYHAQVLSDRPTTPCPLVNVAVQPLANIETEMEMIRLIGNAREFVKGNTVLNPRMKEIEASMQWALYWMRVGYRKAQLRFQGLDTRRLSEIYFRTHQKLEELIKLDAPDVEVKITTNAQHYSVDVEYSRNFNFNN